MHGPVRFNDSGFFGPVDTSISNRNLHHVPMAGGLAVRLRPRHLDNPIVAVSSVVAGRKRVTFRPVGHRTTVLPVRRADFPRADLSALQKG